MRTSQCGATIKHRAPLPQCHVGCGRISLNPRISDENIEPPEHLDEGGEHAANLVLLRHVRVPRDGIASALVDFFDHVVRSISIGVIVDANLRPCFGKSHCHGSADAGAGTGHDGRLAFERLAFRRQGLGKWPLLDREFSQSIQRRGSRKVLISLRLALPT
jgi:hypothetical protein